MIILHLDNGIMSLIIQILSLFLIFVYSIKTVDTYKAVKFGIYTMFIANLVGPLIICGGGASFFIGLLFLPIAGGITGFVTSILYKWIIQLKKVNDPGQPCSSGKS